MLLPTTVSYDTKIAIVNHVTTECNNVGYMSVGIDNAGNGVADQSNEYSSEHNSDLWGWCYKILRKIMYEEQVNKLDSVKEILLV